jgi:predicted transcriptional regulator
MTRLTPVQMEALQVLGDGEMTAEEVANVVNRTRPLMVISLNQLVALGLLEKERRGKGVYFKQRRTEPPRYY